jgi:hypothetical protein
MASSSASEPLIRPEDRSKPPSLVQLGSNLVFPLVESSDVRLDLVPWVGADGVVFYLRSEEVDARVEAHGAPDARRVRRRRLRPRSNPRQANPRGAVVSFSSDLVGGFFVFAPATSNLAYPLALLEESFLALCSNVLWFHVCICLLMDYNLVSSECWVIV